MLFFLSKVLWTLLLPGNLFFLALTVAAALLWSRWRRFGRRLLVVSLAAAAFAVLFRLRDTVSGNEVLVSSEHPFTLTAGPLMMKARLVDFPRRDRHGFAALDIGNVSPLDRLINGPLDLSPRTLHEALAVTQALTLRVQAAIDEIRHAEWASWISPPY